MTIIIVRTISISTITIKSITMQLIISLCRQQPTKH